MLLQKPGEHQPTAERHDRQRERKVDEGDAAHANREQDHGERNDHARHFQAHEPALGRTAKAHVCARARVWRIQPPPQAARYS